jgi:hypothetical protein
VKLTALYQRKIHGSPFVCKKINYVIFTQASINNGQFSITGVNSPTSLFVVAVETGGGGRVLEDPDELTLAAFIPPKLYCMLRIPPEAGLTARAIPVASKIKVIIRIGISQ